MLGMQVTWTGAEATLLRGILGLAQKRFASKAGIALSTVKKWRKLGSSIQLNENSAAIMQTLLDRATPEQRARFVAATASKTADGLPVCDATTDTVGEWVPGMWAADTTVVAFNLTREDLMLDRRQIGRGLFGVVAGAPLLEPLERWLGNGNSPTIPRRARTGVGVQEVEQLENAARVFRSWDDQHGGGLRRKAVVGQLAEVNELLGENHPPELRRRLAGTMAQLAETAAMMSWDSGHQKLAQHYYALSVRASGEARDPAFTAVVVAGMARQLLTLGKSSDALELIRLAQEYSVGRLTATTRAMLYTREAWAYAQLGRPTAFRRASDKAYEVFEDSQPTGDPYWIQYFDAAELSGTLGGRVLDMARRDPKAAGEAIELIDRAITLRRPNRMRSAALDRLGMVEARFIQGEVEEACRVGHAALQVVEQTASDRVAKKLARVYNRTRQHVNVAGVAELRDRMRPLVAATA
ncbi:hypothetical protein [Nocardia gamkensis]|uniref:hypothetical protein n=1 Tax=Nocardia gamkensis TaxID=352869 RepID=UPI0037C901EE